MVFTDHADGFQPAEGAEQVPFRRRGATTSTSTGCRRTTTLVPAMCAWSRTTTTARRRSISRATLEIEGLRAAAWSSTAAHYKTPDEGRALARVRAEERAASSRYFTGESDVCQPSPRGRGSTLEGHPRLDGERSLLVVAVEHQLVQAVALQPRAPRASGYHNTFRAVDAGKTYRPPRVTPRPRIDGVVTGA